MSYESEIWDFTHAIVRTPGPDLALGLTTANLGVPDYKFALEQHTDYVNTLRKLELTIIELPFLPGFPDAHFVEDTAVITPEIAIITRPGADSRREEALHIAPVLEDRFKTARIDDPGTLDGGDVLIIGKNVFVGVSQRTNREGADQLEAILSPFDYKTTRIPLSGGLHLKSSVNYVGENLLLMSEELVDEPGFERFEKMIVPLEETYACNTLWINDNLVVPDGFPETRIMLEDVGLPMHIIRMSEMEKLDGGLTCLSLRF